MKMLPVAVAAAMLWSTAFNSAHAAAEPPDPRLLGALKEVQAQQAQIAENQAKIEVKLVSIGEAVRVARIYASRGGH